METPRCWFSRDLFVNTTSLEGPISQEPMFPSFFEPEILDLCGYCVDLHYPIALRSWTNDKNDVAFTCHVNTSLYRRNTIFLIVFLGIPTVFLTPSRFDPKNGRANPHSPAGKSIVSDTLLAPSGDQVPVEFDVFRQKMRSQSSASYNCFSLIGLHWTPLDLSFMRECYPCYFRIWESQKCQELWLM